MASITTLRSAVWAALAADETLQVLLRGGTQLQWAGGTRKRFLVTPAMCPILSLSCMGAQVPSLAIGPARETSGHDQRSELRHEMLLEIVTAGQDLSDCEAIWDRSITVLAADFAFSLADAAPFLYALDLTDISFEATPDHDAAVVYWRASTTLTARYRTA